MGQTYRSKAAGSPWHRTAGYLRGVLVRAHYWCYSRSQRPPARPNDLLQWPLASDNERVKRYTVTQWVILQLPWWDSFPLVVCFLVFLLNLYLGDGRSLFVLRFVYSFQSLFAVGGYKSREQWKRNAWCEIHNKYKFNLKKKAIAVTTKSIVKIKSLF